MLDQPQFNIWAWIGCLNIPIPQRINCQTLVRPLDNGCSFISFRDWFKKIHLPASPSTESELMSSWRPPSSERKKRPYNPRRFIPTRRCCSLDATFTWIQVNYVLQHWLELKIPVMQQLVLQHCWHEKRHSNCDASRQALASRITSITCITIFVSFGLGTYMPTCRSSTIPAGWHLVKF